MEGSEEFRETLVAMRREIDILRIEATHANLLLTALDTVLCVDGDDDPFAGVFAALLPVFEYTHAIVLIETGDKLECTASSNASFVGSMWKCNHLFDKVLSGRVVTTVADCGLADWHDDRVTGLSNTQPALYLPLGVRGRRGLMILLRHADQPGFDRAHTTLARKFSLLASHAFAAKRASQTEAESHRLKDFTEQLKASQEALTFKANHDQLTGLPNRRYVQDLVDDIIARKRPGQKLALAFLDLDDFKRVNDFYGHAAGDALLKGVADRIQAQLRQSDILGRISGDEFVIVLDPADQRAEIAAITRRVREILQRPFSVEGTEIKTSGSIGVAFYPMHGRDYETLRRHADTAMYQAKTVSKGSVAYFSQALGRKAEEKLSLEHQLRTALAEREFQCALQQKVDIRTSEIVGFEVLMRWIDKGGNVHAPAKFLQAAGELGLLDGMTQVIVDELIGALPRLDALFGSDVKYSVNISAMQTTKIAFMQMLALRICDSGHPRQFILELTEESFAATGPFQTHVLPMLREAGIGISIDDFGTGYSSLTKLADLPVDELKVDRSLITAIHERSRSQSILRAIESLGSALDVSIVAEGIETTDERSYLTSNTRIKIGQGYLFHKPQLLRVLAENISSQPESMQTPISELGARARSR